MSESCIRNTFLTFDKHIISFVQTLIFIYIYWLMEQKKQKKISFSMVGRYGPFFDFGGPAGGLTSDRLVQECGHVLLFVSMCRTKDHHTILDGKGVQVVEHHMVWFRQ